MNNKLLNIVSLILTLFAISACTFPKFKTPSTGVDCSTEKTIFIPQFENQSGLGTSDMQVVFTEKAKDYFQQNSCLELVDSDADVDLICVITGYSISGVAAQQNETAALSKLQITVKVTYTRRLLPGEPNNLKDRNFSFFQNFSKDDDFNSIEAELIDEISEQIVVNIFNSTVGYW